MWATRQDLDPLQEFLKRQTEKMRQSRLHVRRGVGEGVLIVLSLSCLITPPDGEGGSLQQMVGGIHGADRISLTIPLCSMQILKNFC